MFGLLKVKSAMLKALLLALLYFVLVTLIILLEGVNPALQKVFVFLTGIFFVITLKWLRSNIKDLPWFASKTKRERTLVDALIYITAFLLAIGSLISFIK